MATRTAGDALVERTDELRALDELTAAAGGGRGGVVVVEGVGGIGRTALLRAAADRARGAARVHVARGGDIEAQVPLGAARELFAEAVLELPADARAALAGGPARAAADLVAGGEPPRVPDPALALPHAFYWLAVRLAERAPRLLLVDDAHLVDEMSLAALAFLARRLDDQPIGLVVAVDRAPARPPALDDLVARATVVRPAPLSDAGCAALAASVLGERAAPGACAALAVAAGGNPRVLQELLRAAADATGDEPLDAATAERLTPQTLTASLEVRLRRLGGPALRLARSVAILEQSSVPVAAALSGIVVRDAAVAAEELAGAGILSAGLPLRYAQPALRRAALDAIPAADRDTLHRAAARVLADRGDDDRAAVHLLACAPDADPAAVAVLRRAAASAVAQGATPTAVRLLLRAVAEAGPRPPAGLLADLGRAQLALGDAAGVGHLERALAVLDGDRPRERAEVVAALAMAEVGSGGPDRGLERLRTALEGAAPGGEEEGVLLRGYLGLTHAGHAEGTRRLLERRVRAQGGRAADAATAAQVALMAFVAARPAPEVAELARAVLATPDAHAWAGAGPPPLTMAAWTLAGADRFDEADTALEELIAAAQASGSPLLLELAVDTRLYGRWRRGDLRTAQADAERVLELSAMGWDHPVVPARWALCDMLADRGLVAEARAALAPLEPLADDGPPAIQTAWALTAHARVALAAGDPVPAYDRAGRALELLRALGAVNPAVCPAGELAALAALELGEHAAADAIAKTDLVHAEAFGAPRTVAAARRVRALTGGEDERVGRLEHAIAALDGSPALLERARIAAELGHALRRRNALPAARERLREALDLAVRCGADALAERAHGELRAAGGRPRRTRSTGADALTPREEELCALAAAGHTNREIAERLFLTAKTVETHLGRAYRKLGIPGRSGLAAALAARDE